MRSFDSQSRFKLYYFIEIDILKVYDLLTFQIQNFWEQLLSILIISVSFIDAVVILV